VVLTTKSKHQRQNANKQQNNQHNQSRHSEQHKTLSKGTYDKIEDRAWFACSPFTTFGQEPEWVYSVNSEAHRGPEPRSPRGSV